METFIGVNKVPTRLYILQTENGEDVNEEPVTYKELVNMILESDVRDCLAQSWADSGRAGRYECSEERADFYREHAEDEAKECGYRIIEVLSNL